MFKKIKLYHIIILAIAMIFCSNLGFVYAKLVNPATSETSLNDLSVAENKVIRGNSSGVGEETDSLVITSSGIVGIGTTSPTDGSSNPYSGGYKFVVDGDMFLDDHQLFFYNEFGDLLSIANYGFSVIQTINDALADSISISRNSVTGGVWSIDVTSDDPLGIFGGVINDRAFLLATSTIYLDITSYAGTDANPNEVFVYFASSSGSVELLASNTSPEDAGINHIDVAKFTAGTVYNDKVTLYAHNPTKTNISSFISNNHHRLEDEGALRISGLEMTSSSTDITIASGTVKYIYQEADTTEEQVTVDGIFWINNDGTYATGTDFSFGDLYSTGEAIGNNKYFNAVIGIMPETVNGVEKFRLIGLVQKGSTEYTVKADAISDDSNLTVYRPAVSMLNSVFIPVARVIVLRSGAVYSLQTFPDGLYHEDIRIQAGGTGGGSITAVSPWTSDATSIFQKNTALKVGIGTTSPNWELSVVGDQYLSGGNLTIEGDATSTINGGFKICDNGYCCEWFMGATTTQICGAE